MFYRVTLQVITDPKKNTNYDFHDKYQAEHQAEILEAIYNYNRRFPSAIVRIEEMTSIRHTLQMRLAQENDNINMAIQEIRRLVATNQCNHAIFEVCEAISKHKKNIDALEVLMT